MVPAAAGLLRFGEEQGASQTLSPDRRPQGTWDRKEQDSTPLLC